MTLLLGVIYLIFNLLSRISGSNQLPLCGMQQDSYGQWYDVKNTSDIPIKNYFTCGQPGEAIDFSQVWLPNNCSYHRFTNKSFFNAVSYAIRKRIKISSLKPSSRLLVILVGDSALRGIFCGITRIAAGSELFGPCENIVCGAPDMLPVSHTHLNNKRDRNEFVATTNHGPSKGINSNKIKLKKELSLMDTIHYVDFGSTARFGFLYFQSFIHYNHRQIEDTFRQLIELQPMSIIFNTGAWDFDTIARRNKSSVAQESCNTEETESVSKQRSSEALKNLFLRIGMYAKSQHVQLIYRNNHYNQRFGAICADEKLEQKIFTQLKVYSSLLPSFASSPVSSPSSSLLYTIFDNRRISKDIWTEQTYDGFHFDRNRVHTREHHQRLVDEFRSKYWNLPGQLEIQLAQSLLNLLFHDFVYEYTVYQPQKINETLCS